MTVHTLLISIKDVMEHGDWKDASDAQQSDSGLRRDCSAKKSAIIVIEAFSPLILIA
jgi:hypothetical protein